MRIYGTPPSHFTRKVRVLLQELGLPYEFKVFEMSRLGEVGEENFAGNPLHLIPVLDDGAEKIFDSSIICEYLIDRYGAGKEISSYYPVASEKVRDQKRLIIINGAMSAGVSLIRAKRSGIEAWDDYAFFRQEKAAIAAAQRWLEKELGARTSFYKGRFTMLEISLQCLLEWAAFRGFILPEGEIPNLYAFMRHQARRPSFAGTHPSLMEAKQ